MQLVIRTLLISTAGMFLLSQPTVASVVFQPGKKAKYVPPGEEELSGDAAQLYQIAQTAEKEGNLKRAVSAYRNLLKHHPKDALAPTALYRAAQVQEQLHNYTPAAQLYSELVERYPSSPNFDQAI